MENNIVIIPKLIEKKDIKINPLFFKVKEKSNDYIRKKLNIKCFDINLAYWSSICYPNINDEKKMYNITNLFTLLFIIDDELENNRINEKNIQRYIDILENIIQPHTKFENVLKEIWNAIKIELSFFQKKRFIKYIQEWINGAKYLAKVKHNINYDEYLYFRFKSIGANASFIIIEYEFNIKFDSTILKNLENIHNIAGENIIFINDLFSYRKELYENNYNLNIIDIIINYEKCNLQKAIDILEIYIKDNFNNFNIIYMDLIKKQESKHLKLYLDELLNLMYDNLKWSCISPRYHGKDFNNTLINGAKIKLDKNKTIIL